MSKASSKAHAKVQAKTGKVRATRSRRPAPGYGENVAALALTERDLAGLRWAASVCEENKLIFVKCKEVRAKCPACEHRFVAKKESQHEVKLPDLEKAAATIYRILSKAGSGGASLWFAKGG